MSAERMKVLEMLAAGKITAPDAEKLIEKLEGASPSQATSADSAGEGGGGEKKKPKYLRIVVDSPGKEQVNVRVPFSFVRANMKLVNVLPERLTERLADHGIGIAGIAGIKGLGDGDAVEDLDVEVEKPGGKKVRIFCE
jgi:hypothetical protein